MWSTSFHYTFYDEMVSTVCYLIVQMLKSICYCDERLCSNLVLGIPLCGRWCMILYFYVIMQVVTMVTTCSKRFICNIILAVSHMTIKNKYFGNIRLLQQNNPRPICVKCSSYSAHAAVMQPRFRYSLPAAIVLAIL